MPVNGKHHAIPKPGIPRPPLPVDHANPKIRTIDISQPPPVKFQEIMREGSATVVGRIKIPTPTGHAFILRRLDTGAISLTTMFRAAFPTATDDAEKAETNWVKMSYDIAGANKSGKARFAGTWVNPEVAVALAEGYALGGVIPSLAAAVPDPNIIFRRSSKAQGDTPTSSPAAPSATSDGPAPAKRRREASPATSIISTAATTASTIVAPRSPSPSRVAPSPAPRRSTRIKSPGRPAPPPAIAAVVPPSPKSTAKPRSKGASKRESARSLGSDDTAVDEDAAETTKITEVNMQEDIREQKELIARLKAEKKEKAALVATESEAGAAAALEGDESTSAKRPRDEGEKLAFNFKEPEVGERAVVSNRRVFTQMPPERKSLAWGALAFAAGVGAVTFLPNLQGILF